MKIVSIVEAKERLEETLTVSGTLNIQRVQKTILLGTLIDRVDEIPFYCTQDDIRERLAATDGEIAALEGVVTTKRTGATALHVTRIVAMLPSVLEPGVEISTRETAPTPPTEFWASWVPFRSASVRDPLMRIHTSLQNARLSVTNSPRNDIFAIYSWNGSEWVLYETPLDSAVEESS